ncbi:MAG: DMT family transporter [Pseudomonadota bacterium]
MSLLTNPRVRLLLGAALISFSPVFVALVSVSSTNSAFYRVAIGGAVLLLWVLFDGRGRWPRRGVLAVLVLAAGAFALDLWFWHQSIRYVGPGLSTLLANFQVFVMTAAGFFLLGQKPTLSQLVSIPLALLGLALIVGFDWQSLSRDYQLGVIYGLLTAASYAAYLLTFRHAQSLRQHSGDSQLPTRELTIVSLAAAVFLAVGAVAEGETLRIPTLADAAWLTAYAVLAHILGWLLIASSLAHVPATLIGLSLLLQPLLSFVWDVLFFGRVVSGSQLVGAMLALVAIYFGARSRRAVTHKRDAVG